MLIKIHRMDQLTNFTMVPNAALRNKNLTWKAKGILAYLLSHEDGYQLNRATITNASAKDGDTVVRSALQELEDAGYLLRERQRSEVAGVFDKAVWHICAFGNVNRVQEDLPMHVTPEPAPNLELFPGDTAAATARAAARASGGEVPLTAPEFLDRVLDTWHDMITMARPVDVFKVAYQRPKATAARLRHIRARLKDPEWMKAWRDAVTRIGKIEGLHGRVKDARDGRTFTCDVDWFLKPETVTKVMEGKYDNWRNTAPAHAPAESAKKAYTGGL